MALKKRGSLLKFASEKEVYTEKGGGSLRKGPNGGSNHGGKYEVFHFFILIFVLFQKNYVMFS